MKTRHGSGRHRKPRLRDTEHFNIEATRFGFRIIWLCCSVIAVLMVVGITARAFNEPIQPRNPTEDFYPEYTGSDSDLEWTPAPEDQPSIQPRNPASVQPGQPRVQPTPSVPPSRRHHPSPRPSLGGILDEALPSIPPVPLPVPLVKPTPSPSPSKMKKVRPTPKPTHGPECRPIPSVPCLPLVGQIL